jgi:hypothetical protein
MDFLTFNDDRLSDCTNEEKVYIDALISGWGNSFASYETSDRSSLVSSWNIEKGKR